MMLKITNRVFAMVFAMAFFMVSCSKEEGNDVNEMDAQQTSFADVIPGQYIVVYRESGKSQGNYLDNQKAVQNKTREIISESNIASAEILSIYSATISGATLKLSADDVSKLKGSKEIAYIEQDRIITLARPGSDDTEAASAQETPYGIARVNGVTGYTGSNVAWIIDTGIDLDHEDLNVDESRGFNAFTRGKDGQSLDDGNGHGSHVAGTVAAKNNDVGVIGVAPDATVIPVKVLDQRGSGTYSGVIAGVDHVGANGEPGDVANMSLGGSPSDALDDAVVAASNNGIWFSLAAGNDSDDANNHSPARANGEYIVTISAMDVNDDWASFSNYGNPPVDYAAPGVSVKSTWKDGGYNTISGTSMAAPHAAGVLLLGNASIDGSVNGDPDGNPDPIIVH